MELSKNDMRITKGVAILFMLLLHLFCRKNIDGLYYSFINVHGAPLIYYFGLFGDACVPMYCFASGYGLFVSNAKSNNGSIRNNFKRILKLLINYWIVLILFVAIGYIAGMSEIYPGTLSKFVLNLLLIRYTYNGSWWFLQTYIILVVLLPVFIKLIRRYTPVIILIVSISIYFVAYVQRIKHTFYFGDNLYLNTIIEAIVDLGTSQFSFIVGAVFAKEHIYSKLYNRFKLLKHKNIICIGGTVGLVVLHGIYESMIIAPFTGVAFICLFNFASKSPLIKAILTYLGNHSTNIWLIHMFFYMLIFPKLVFAPKYPIIIFIWLLVLCLASSYLVSYLCKYILWVISRRKVSNLITG